MHKFRARDGRDVSFHVYYQSQQERLVKALGLAKPSSEYGFFTMKTVSYTHLDVYKRQVLSSFQSRRMTVVFSPVSL